jgi:hypothetical protein
VEVAAIKPILKLLRRDLTIVFPFKSVEYMTGRTMTRSMVRGKENRIAGKGLPDA